MQGVACRKGWWFTILWTASVAVLLAGLPLANGNCEFPASWKGKWFLHGRDSPVIVNSTTFENKTCIESNKEDVFVVRDNTEGCYRCMIINLRHESVIQYRESDCSQKQTLSQMSEAIKLDESLNTMFRVDAKPIPCPFQGPPFTFSYSRGRGDCKVPENQAESCTDDSKLIFKYQACPDIAGTESSTEELQCLATWREGSRNTYLVGTLKPGSTGSRTTVVNEVYRCFLFEKTHRQGKVEYQLAQSGDATCNGLTTVSEGSQTIKLTKEDKERRKCKYPSWVLKHHAWHTLNGAKNYHFLAGNSTLKVSYKDENVTSQHEEKIVCHNLETEQKANSGTSVKLVAHVTSGCDIGYVCMIFHQRDQHIIEIQQSEQKAIIPDEACKLWDPSRMPYTTLITSSLHKRRCPQPGRYSILNSLPSQALSSMRRRNKRRAKSAESTTSKIRQDDEYEQCRSTDVHIGCNSMDQNEVIMAQSCKSGEIATLYSCQGSWEENGTWFTIVSRNKSSSERQTHCFSMRFSDPSDKLGGRNSRMDSSEQELLLSKPSNLCQRNVDDQWSYRLMSQGVCEDLTKAASSSASSSSRVSFALLIGAAVMSRLLSR
ncbi:uncharacterized protein LOC127288445 [Leptopilina boulardi]|uniref:uncharacterized protein LOC127288445 n=1 Tax=Leptopilina boulardi TaxID=63433 RepID=UPI0021F51195|nr:uncharacterized protein LOC127288445 [Leptopilina boulardi]XP_051171862.1 uncharacterized protein LOC127288445 [Leptopilina boulardi]